MMLLQIDCPKDNDPYFNTPAKGGISTCIVPPNPEKGLNTLPNCVAAAWGCFNKAAAKDAATPYAKYLNYPPDAGRKWLLRAQQQGLTISNVPDVGCVVVWGKKVNTDKGHVAFVYKVDADGTIYTAESEYEGRVWVNRKYAAPYIYGSAYTLLGFILQPSRVRPVLREGSRGQDVTQMQLQLIRRGYMRKNEADGDFGKITKGALLCFQFENKLEVDAVCGAQTWAALEK